MTSVFVHCEPDPAAVPMTFDSFIQDYKRDGVVRVRGLFDAQETNALRYNIDRYRNEIAPVLPAADVTFEPDGVTVRNLWRMQQHDAFFNTLAESSALKDLVAPLINGLPVLMGVETFNKPPRVGTAVPPHQDNAYFCQSPPDVLSVWVAIDAATEENGAVEYSLGSHFELLPHVASGVRGNSFGLATPPPSGQFRTMIGTVEPGDALIHHGLTIHRSEPNISSRSRLSLVFVYRGEHTQTDDELLKRYRQAQSC